MVVALTDEQLQLTESMAGFVKRHGGHEHTRARFDAIAAGRRPDFWAVLVAQGLTNRQIARRLGIAEWTAVNHVRNVMRKMRCSSRVHVASMITQGGVREMREVSGG